MVNSILTITLTSFFYNNDYKLRQLYLNPPYKVITRVTLCYSKMQEGEKEFCIEVVRFKELIKLIQNQVNTI